MNYKSGVILLVFFLVFFSCKTNAQHALIGTWYNDDNWFEFTSDSTYNTGINKITFFKNLKYTSDATTNELTLYTEKKEVTYYLKYTFLQKDSLELRNLMNGAKTSIVYTRK